METETSLPIPPSNAGAPATAPTTAPATAPAAAPSAEQPWTSQAAAEQPATSDQPAAAPLTEAAPSQQAEPNTVAGEQAAAAADPAQQQQANNAAASADPAANAMQDANSPFIPGTVLRFDMDAGDVTDRTGLDFRAIRPIFGGKEGGVRHCDYQRVIDDLFPICKHLASHYQQDPLQIRAFILVLQAVPVDEACQVDMLCICCKVLHHAQG